LGLIGLYFEVEFYSGLFSIAPVPGYLDLVPLFSFIGGVALVFGANFVKRKSIRIGLVVIVVVIFVFFTVEMGSAISTAQLENPFVLGEVLVTSATCNPSPTLECTFVLQNEGADPVQARGAFLTSYGGMLSGTCDHITINDGTSASLHCSWPNGTTVSSQIQSGVIPSETQTSTSALYTSTTESAPQYSGYVIIGNLVGYAQLPFTTN